MSKLNPRVDFAFKKLFGSEETKKEVLIPFLNAILPPRDQVASVELVNPYNLKDYPLDKLTILDIRAIDTQGRQLTIEMQVTDQLHYEKRALFCWSDVYAKQLSEGQGYSDLQKTIAIHVLNFNLLDETNYHNIYKIKNIESQKEAFQDFQLHTIELKKFDGSKPLQELKTSLDRWVTFLTKAHDYSKAQVPIELQAEPGIEKAITILDTLYLDDFERQLYEGHLKWLRDEDAAIELAEHRGKLEGKREGIVEGKLEGERIGIEIGMEKGKIEIAKALKMSEIPLSDIQKYTGIPLSQLESL